MKYFVSDDGANNGLFWVAEVNHNESGIATNVGVVPSDRYGFCAAQDIVGVEGDASFQEIVGWVSVEQRCCADHDQPFDLVRYVYVRVERMDGGFEVLRSMGSCRVGSDGRWGCDCGRELGSNIETLPQR